MSGDEKMDPEEGNHENFLVSMSKIGKSDGRFRLQHKNDETQVLNQPLSELMGENVTIENLLQPVSGKTTQDGDSTTTNKNQLQKDFKKSYEKSVNKNQNLRLAAPASSVQEAKMNRSATRTKFSEQMNKWDAAVHSRRAASSISYPLQKADMSLKTSDDQSQNFKAKTPLEEEVHMLLYGSTTKDNTPNAGIGLSIRETREKLNELAKVRAHVAYQQTKLKRQNKIKSRKYRRQLRKEKKKELEQLQKNDKELPEDNELDRITERATLKHSKSSKNLHFVAKHADNTVKNQVLAAKDKKRRQLIEKAKPNSEHSSSAGEDSEHDPQDNDETNYSLPKDPNNPWTNNEDQLLKLIKDNSQARIEEQKKAEKNIDPNAFLKINVKSQNFSAGDNLVESGSDEDDLSGTKSKIYEAFAEDDDIMRDFKKEAKEKQEARNKGKQNSAKSLPGWGNWGSNTSKGKTKAKNDRAKLKNRLNEMKNGPKEARNPKHNKGYQVIINDSAKGQAARAHQPTSLPFPFTGVKDFEASIRTPIGDTFIPRTSFKKLVQPKINVAKGAIVDPMDKTELVNRGIAFDENDKEEYEANVV